MIVQSHMNDHSGTQKQFITNRFSRTLLWLATLSLIFSQHNFNSVIFPKAKGKRDALQYVAHLWTAFNIYTEQDLRLRKSILEWSRLLPGTYLNRCVAVKFKWFSLPILQVHFQNIWHKKQRVVLYRFLRMKKKHLINKSQLYMQDLLILKKLKCSTEQFLIVWVFSFPPRYL